MIVVTYKGLIDAPKKQVSDFSIKRIERNEDCLGESIFTALVVEETDSKELIRDVDARIYNRFLKNLL